MPDFKDLDRSQPVDIMFDKIIKKHSGAFLFEIEGSDTWIGFGVIENIDEIEEHFKEEGNLEHVIVPLWLAVDNGWMEWEDGV